MEAQGLRLALYGDLGDVRHVWRQVIRLLETVRLVMRLLLDCGLQSMMTALSCLVLSLEDVSHGVAMVG